MNIRVKYTLAGWAVIAGATLASSVTAADAHRLLSSEITAGIQYDSNVTVDDIDQVTNLGDVATVIDAGIDYRVPLSGKTEARFGYDLSQSFHQDFSQFDLQTHMASAELSREFGRVNAGVTYRYIHARLDGHGFLTIQQLAPALSLSLGAKVMIRTTFTYADKTFQGRPLRDSIQNTLALDGYYFVDGSSTYLSGGYKYAREKAGDRQFSYNADNLKLKFVKRLTLWNRKSTAQVQWQFEDRRYVGANPVILAPRHDRRNILTTELEIPLTRRIFTAADYSVGDYGSNLPSADYRQTVATLKIGAKF